MNTGLRDITNEEDIRHLVDSFYKKVVEDQLIGVIFTEVIQLSWQTHIPVMYRFWGSLLLGNKSYEGNPMITHMELDSRYRLNAGHFERWLKLWKHTVGENFTGEKASEAVARAENIAALMLYKIENNRKN